MYNHVRNYEQLFEILNENTLYTAAMIDIDYFIKTYQETDYDNIIKESFEFFQAKLPYKIIYLGKDEFTLLSIDKNDNASSFIVKLSELIGDFKAQFHTSFSAAIAEFPTSFAEDYIEFVRHLEETLHQSKQVSRGRVTLGKESKMKLKSNYYTPSQLDRLSHLSKRLNRTEASILREAIDLVLRKYEE
jgi:GGDEF domain-containing protein